MMPNDETSREKKMSSLQKELKETKRFLKRTPATHKHHFLEIFCRSRKHVQRNVKNEHYWTTADQPERNMFKKRRPQKPTLYQLLRN